MDTTLCGRYSHSMKWPLNSTLHSDARATTALCKGRQALAGY